MLIGFATVGQDSIYPPEHVRDYIVPSALQEDNEQGCPFSLYETFLPIDAHYCNGWFRFPLNQHIDKYTLAIPYYSDTLVSIYGVSVIAWHKDTDANISVKIR